MQNPYFMRGNRAERGNETNKRRTKMILLALSALMLMQTLLSGCADAAPERYERVYLDLFDTVTTVILYDTSEQSANARMEELHALLLEYHRLYDIYDTYDGINNLCTVNENAGVAPVAVDERILDLIEYAKGMDALTNGGMNIAMGGVLSIWQSYRDAGLDDPDNAELPPMEALQAAGEHTNIDSIEIDRTAGTLYLSDSETQIDVGAVAKGYAAQQAIEAMKAEGVSAMLLSLGGNVCSIGVRADGSDWKVAVRDPYSDGNLYITQIAGQSVVTSGTYERYYTVDGVRYHHIIDPQTLMPSTRYDSVTVISENSALADALTTGLFCMSAGDGLKLVNSLSGVEALWVISQGVEQMSEGFSAYLAD